GFEKTFLDGLMSYQIALPFTSGLGSDIELLNENLLAPSAIPQDAELGDLALALKAILWQRPRYAVAGGLAVTLPTADDFVYSETFIDTVGVFSELRIENEAVHLKPYLGFLYLPNDRCFIQGFAQLD